MKPQKKDRPERDPDHLPDVPTSPYGPQRDLADEAAGGADSSPYEATPSGEKADAAENQATTRRPPKTQDRPASGR